MPPPGLTSNLRILTAQAQNVLAVPSRLIRRSGRDQVVDVLVDGKKETKTVTTGLSNDTLTEIKSGLAEGDKVALPVTTTRAAPVPGGGGIGGLGGIR